MSTPITRPKYLQNCIGSFVKRCGVFVALCLVLCWLTIASVQAQTFKPAFDSAPPVQVDNAFRQQAIGLMLDIFEDTSGKLSVSDVRSALYARQFVRSVKESPSLGYTSSAYWARFSIQDIRNLDRNAAGDPLFLMLTYASTDLAELWCTDAKGQIVLQQRAGDHVPRAEWPDTYREPTFKLTPAVEMCWLRVHSSSAIHFPLTLSTQQDFFEMRLKDNALQSLYFGALLVMVVYNGLLALSTRAWAYGSYTLFLIGYGLFLSAFNGIGFAVIWPPGLPWNDAFTPFFMTFAGVMSIFFATSLLDLRNTAPRWCKFGNVIAAVFLLHSGALWLLPNGVATKIVMLGAPFWVVFLLGSGMFLAAKGFRVAQIYICAWFVFIVGTVILIATRFDLVPINPLTLNATQIGSVIEFILLSFALAYRIKTLQNQLLDSVRAESAALNLAAQAQTDSMLANARSETQKANNAALQVQAELSRKDAELAQKEADYTKEQLQQADKMASLGQLVASVTHEINTPIGAISSSGQSIAEALSDVVAQLPPLLRQLDSATSTLLVELLQQANSPKAAISSREERALIKKVTEQLETAGLEHPRQKANFLLGFQAHNAIDKFLPLLQHPQAEQIQQAASNLSLAMRSATNVNVAVERVTKIVKALKSFSHFNIGTEKIEANLTECMETVLTIYQGQTKVGVEVVRNYEDIPPLMCFPDELSQVWTNLVHNALHAMNHEGVLTIGIRKENDCAVVSVGDSGCGIPEEIRGKIFDVFFTTKPAGVGSGLGLDIVKKIIQKHNGRIDLQSEVGIGTIFSVYLPYKV